MRKSPRTFPTWFRRARRERVGIIGETNGVRPPVPAPPGSAPSPLESPLPAPGADGGSLRRRRDALAEQVRELHWDLGGLAYEMAIRDHFRLDVLVRRAATLQEHDAQLAEVERLLRMEDGATAGECPRCSAPHSRGAVYCWQCGTTLMERLPSAALSAENDTTGVMNALLTSSEPSAHDPDE